MAAHVSRARGFPARGPRRQTIWGSTVTPTATIIAAGTKVLLARFTAASLASIGVPNTVVRERGQIWYASDQNAATESVVGAVGLCVVSELAAAAGAASIPGPITNADWDGWYGWFPMLTRIEFSDATGVQNPAGVVMPFDTKAMRKVEDNMSVVVMVESVTNGLRLTYASRTLFKLH